MAACMSPCCVFYTALHTGTLTGRLWPGCRITIKETQINPEICWVKSSRQTSPDYQSSSVLAPNWADDNDSMSEMFSPHLLPLWQKLALKITHSLGHKVVCWGMNEYFVPFCKWDTVVLWVWVLGELVLISCSFHDSQYILPGLTQWTLITSLWQRGSS